MAGTLVVNQLQLGDNATATQNFVWRTNSDGTATLARGNVGATTQDILTVDSSGLVTLTQGKQMTLTASQATTSGTSKDFTSIPSWVKRITVMLSDVSTNGTSLQQVQIGDSGGVETSGYSSAATTNGVTTTSTTGFLVNYRADAANQTKGALVLTLLDASTNLWVAQGATAGSGGAIGDVSSLAGNKALSATLDRVRITTVNGTDAFDAGSVSILYEG